MKKECFFKIWLKTSPTSSSLRPAGKQQKERAAKALNTPPEGKISLGLPLLPFKEQQIIRLRFSSNCGDTLTQEEIKETLQRSSQFPWAVFTIITNVLRAVKWGCSNNFRGKFSLLQMDNLMSKTFSKKTEVSQALRGWCCGRGTSNLIRVAKLFLARSFFLSLRNIGYRESASGRREREKGSKLCCGPIRFCSTRSALLLVLRKQTAYLFVN